MSTNDSTSKTSTSTSTVSSSRSATLAHAPTPVAPEIANFMSAIDSFAVWIAEGYEVPQPAEARRLPKPRKEAPTIVSMLADMAARYGVASKAYPVSAILANQQVVSTLLPVIERIGAVQKLVQAMSRTSQSGAWEGAMVTYGLLKTEARGNAVLRSALAPVREKMRPAFVTEDGTKTKLKGRAAPKPKGPAPAVTSHGASASPTTAAAAAPAQPSAPHATQ